MKQFYSLAIMMGLFLTTAMAAATMAKAEDSDYSADVPVTTEPTYLDAIITGNSNADRSPAGWYSEPEDDDSSNDSGADFAGL
jgi:hypothetical protein